MSLKNLEEFLNNKKKDTEVKINWEEVKEKWLKEIDNFYTQVQSWLKEYETKNLLKIDFEEVTKLEEHIGEYKARKMRINISNESVFFDPVGALIIGARGRIDMIGKCGRIKLLLVGKNSSSPRIIVNMHMENKLQDSKNDADTKEELEVCWKIATPPPGIKYIELNADSFSDALLEVIND